MSVLFFQNYKAQRLNFKNKNNVYFFVKITSIMYKLELNFNKKENFFHVHDMKKLELSIRAHVW